MTGIFVAELASILTAAGITLPTLGAGITFIWRKVEAAARERETKFDERLLHIELELDHCRERERISQDRRAVHITVIELLWQEAMRLSRKAENATLDRAKKLLDDLKVTASHGSTPEKSPHHLK